MGIYKNADFESKYYIQDKDGNTWGETKPFSIDVSYGGIDKYPTITLEGHLKYDVDVLKASQMPNHNHSITSNGTVLWHNINGETVASISSTGVKCAEIEVDKLSTISGMMSWEEWTKHKEESKIKKGEIGMEILEIWKKRKRDKLFAELKEAKEKIIKSDEITTRVAEFKEKLEEEYKMYVGVDLNIGALTKESEEIIAQAEQEHDLELEALRKRSAEIEAQLKICETYEQKIDILVSYGIIDKKTKQIIA